MCIYKSKLMLVAFVLANLAALWGVFRLRINTELSAFMEASSAYMDALHDVEETFGSRYMGVFLIEFPSGKKSKIQEALEKLSADVEKIKGVNHVLYPGEEVEKYMRKGKAFSVLFEKGDKTYASIYVIFDKEATIKTVSLIEDVLRSHNLKYFAVGDLYVRKKIFDYILTVLCFLPPIAGSIMFATFRGQLGTAKATVFSILPAGIGALWTLGLLGLIGKKISVVLVLVPVFTIVMGSAYGLHFVSHFLGHLRDYSKEDALNITVRETFVPILMTTLTTVAGFSSLALTKNVGMRDMGLWASFAILLAFAATFTVLPAILCRVKKIEVKPPARSFVRIASWLRDSWGAKAIGVFTLLVVAFAFGIPKVKPEFHQLLFFREFTKIYKAIDKFREIYGGLGPVFVEVEFDKSPLLPSCAREASRIEEAILSTGKVGRAFSYFDIFSLANEILSNREGYPKSALTAAIIYSTLAKKGMPITSFLNIKRRKALVLAYPRDLTAETLRELEKAVEKIRPSLKRVRSLRVTGSSYVMKEVSEKIVANQTTSLAWALAFIFGMLILTFRSFLPALCSIVPIAGMLVIFFGFMGYLKIPLNIITGNISNISIGVGIDYAIHFTSFTLLYLSRGAASPREEAFRTTSRPILANALGLVFGMCALLLSPLKFHLYVAIMMWVSMIMSFIFSLTVLPTLLGGLERRR